MVGVAGTETPAARPTVIVSPALSAPTAVKLIVQVERASAVAGAATHATPVVGVVAALMMRFGGLAGVTSALVAIAMLLPVIVCAVGLVRPASVSCPLPPADSVQPAPSVIVTVGPVAEPAVFVVVPDVVLPQPA